MSDKLVVVLASVLIVFLAAILVARTVLIERAAGDGTVREEAMRRARGVRRLDLVAILLAVLVVAMGLLRVVLGTVV